MIDQTPSSDARIEALKQELLQNKRANELAAETLVSCAMEEILLEYEMGESYKEWKAKNGEA